MPTYLRTFHRYLNRSALRGPGCVFRTDCKPAASHNCVVFGGLEDTAQKHHQLQCSTDTMADVPLLVVSENSSAERRITPAWSISTLKAKLETVTGIPPSAQRILLKTAAEGSVPIEANDEDSTHLTAFRLTAYAELHVSICPLRSPEWSLFLPS